MAATPEAIWCRQATKDEDTEKEREMNRFRRACDYFANKDFYPTSAYPNRVCRVIGHKFDKFDTCKRCGITQNEAIRQYILHKHFVKDSTK